MSIRYVNRPPWTLEPKQCKILDTDVSMLRAFFQTKKVAELNNTGQVKSPITFLMSRYIKITNYSFTKITK